LRPEISRAEIWPDNLGNDAFEDFEKTTECAKGCRRQPWSPGFFDPSGTNQQLAHRIDQQKPKREMDHAIVMIAF